MSAGTNIAQALPSESCMIHNSKWQCTSTVCWPVLQHVQHDVLLQLRWSVYVVQDAIQALHALKEALPHEAPARQRKPRSKSPGRAGQLTLDGAVRLYNNLQASQQQKQRVKAVLQQKSQASVCLGSYAKQHEYKKQLLQGSGAAKAQWI